jgi:hypothetical protein
VSSVWAAPSPEDRTPRRAKEPSICVELLLRQGIHEMNEMASEGVGLTAHACPIASSVAARVPRRQRADGRPVEMIAAVRAQRQKAIA